VQLIGCASLHPQVGDRSLTPWQDVRNRPPSSPLAEPPCVLAPEELQEIGVEPVLVGGGQTVWSSLVVLLLGSLDQLG
jgi:hypothetical protein